jgi:nitroimidazol reductase NimA-like FMN-containing flavoprotein (pyridoxamine 5'-phosphate oxidase superfamily)
MSAGPKTSRRSVRMTEEEIWEFVTEAHTGIFTTLRRDGTPVALPIWFAALDRRLYVSTRGKKVLRARNDQRCSFLVETGERWAELRAVHLTCRATVLEEVTPDLEDRIRQEMDRKYASARTPSRAMPESTRQHYAQAAGATIELTPTGRVLSWDNRHLGLD